MGLAASQCRLLFITQRQNDVSAKMQKISMDRMSLARDEDDIETKYNRMMSVTKYQNANGSDISYNALMGANAAEQGNFGIITNAGGAVVLNQALANKFGLTGDGNGAAFKTKFPTVEKLIEKAEPTNASNIIAKLDDIDGDNGGDGDGSNQEHKLESIMAVVTYYMGGHGEKPMTDDGTFHFSSDGKDPFNGQYNINVYDTGSNEFNNFINGTIPSAELVKDNNFISGVWGTKIEDEKTKNNPNAGIDSGMKSLGALYQEAGSITGTMVLGTSNNETPTFNDISAKFTALTNAVGQSLCNNLAGISYLDAEKVSDLVKAQNNALSSVYKDNLKYNADFYKNFTSVDGDSNYKWDDNKFQYNENAMSAAMEACRGRSIITAATSYSDGHGNPWVFAVDVGNYVKQLVDNVMNALSGNSLSSSDMSGNKTIDNTKNFTVATQYISTSSGNDGNPPPTADEKYKNLASYYSNLFDKLSSYGWTTQSAETIQSNLNQGLYYISGTQMSASDRFDKVTDEDAKEAAKHWYDVETKKIKRKEDAMTIEDTKLQTEYQSLTSDIQSVQGIINQNIQKSFTYCAQG